MEVKTLNGKKVKYYDSIDELPIVNYQKFNKYVLFSSFIGSDINAVVQHHANILKLIDVDKAKAKLELQNTMQSLMFIENNISPDLMAFACLIYSIDGEKITDYSDTNLKAVIDSIKEEKFKVIKALLDVFKKKLKTELETYYPDFFSTKSQENTNFFLLVNRTNSILDFILAESEEEKKLLEEKIKNIDLKIANLYKVVTFSGTDSYEIRFDKQFESSCLAIAQETGLSPYSLTVLQFFGLLENLTKQAKQKAKYNKNGR